MAESLMFAPDSPIAASLRVRVADAWRTYIEVGVHAGVALPTDAAVMQSLPRVWACSDFVSQSCVRDPRLLADLIASGDLTRAYRAGDFSRKVTAAIGITTDLAGLGAALRHLRRREMVRIAWRDLAGWAPLVEVLADLSDLACACVEGALACLHRWQGAEFGMPIGSQSGAPQSLVVVGMGKLGGGELNFSSDIDLMYAYAEDGETQGGRRSLSNEEYFARLSRDLTRVLDERTADGFVFRVDTRLRPFGEAGPLAVSFDAMENYYQSHGREWERYAWIKARVVAGDGAALMTRLRPFVYRRYLDYGAFQSLREMKAMIAQQVRRKGMEDNIKLGAGGIREVEFIGQVFQLVRGGREPRLQERAILKVLATLSEQGYLPEYARAELAGAYVFLRRAENRLQAIADQQTHQLPSDELDCARLALAMGYGAWPDFVGDLRMHMQRVHSHFEQVFATPQVEEGAGLAAVWQGALDNDAAQAALVTAGYVGPAEVLRHIDGLRASASYRALSSQGRERLDALMPLLLGAAGQAEQPAITLQRVVAIVERIARRTTYLALLVENPLALSQLVRLCAASPWIAALLARHPLLLDELMDPRRLYAPRDKSALARDLEGALGGVSEGDLEEQMERLRHFKQASVLRVAAADVAGIYPLMVVSDHLTDIAEVVLERVLSLARSYLTAHHGAPRCRENGVDRDVGFVIIGYGKLGGIELGYGSDLDLVFLHDSAGEVQMTAGGRSVDNAVFFARLGQRIIHMLSAHTPAGVLYEVDMRLRPSGNAGLLVSSVETYADYQRSEAWTWEHQALMRARVVAGDARVAVCFADIRREVLRRPRERDRLRREVRDMRERMRLGLSNAGLEYFDLKQDQGGIADIEFMVQYHVLAWAHDFPELLQYTDNIRVLQGIAQAGLMTQGNADFLAEAYRAYRARMHRLTLQELPAVISTGEFQDFRSGVVRLWHALFGA